MTSVRLHRRRPGRLTALGLDGPRALATSAYFFSGHVQVRTAATPPCC